MRIVKVCFALLLGLSLILSHLPAIAKSRDNNDLFKTLLPQLKKKTKVPLKLPTYFAAEGEEPLYAMLEQATSGRYEIDIAFDPECHTATACDHGAVIGEVIKKLSPLKGQRVKLVQGITGYFTDAKCGASCSNSELSWEQKGYRYTVGIKAGSKKELIKVANSAIVNSVTLPSDSTSTTISSAYTKISQKSCKMLKKDPDEGYTMSCPGIGNYSLLVHGLEHSDRYSMSVSVVAPSKKKYPLRFQSQVLQSFGLPLDEKVEWRVTKKGNQRIPVGLIIRSKVQHEKAEGEVVGPPVSYLVVSKLTAKEICIVNQIKLNGDAAQTAQMNADQSAQAPCLKNGDGSVGIHEF